MKKITNSFLNRTSSIAGINMIDFSKKSSWVFLESGVASMSSLLLVFVYANYLNPEAFGTFKFTLSLLALFSALSLSGLGVAAIREFANKKESCVSDLFKINLKWSFAIFIATTLSASYYYIQGDTKLSAGILIAGLIYPFTQSFLLYESYLIGRQKIRQKAVLSIIKYLLVSIAIATSVLLVNSFIVLITVYSVVQVSLAAILYKTVCTRYPSTDEISAGSIDYSKHLSAMSILSRIANHIDQILIFYFLGAAQLAVYVMALTIPQNIKGVFFGLKNIIMPKLATKDIEEIKKVVPYKTFLFFLALLIVALIYSILSPFLFNYVFPNYTDSIPLTQLLAFTIVFTATMPLRQTFLAHARKKELYISQFSVPILKIILTAILIPIYGIWGAAIALLTTRAYSSILYIFMFIKLR